MAYTQRYQPTDIEKRIGAIRSQLYGKQTITLKDASPEQRRQLDHDHSLATRDLVKTALLGTIALALQFALFAGINLGVIKL